jgi:hypothetical protein
MALIQVGRSRVSGNDQFLVRVIRKKINDFAQAETDEERMKAIMAVSALSATALIDDRQMVQSTIRYIESRL